MVNPAAQRIAFSHGSDAGIAVRLAIEADG
jgi:hypothetical protein